MREGNERSDGDLSKEMGGADLREREGESLVDAVGSWLERMEEWMKDGFVSHWVGLWGNVVVPMTSRVSLLSTKMSCQVIQNWKNPKRKHMPFIELGHVYDVKNV